MLKTKLEVVTVGAPDVAALSENEQRIFFETIAAVMDGAGIFSILFRVIVPIIKPAIATMVINTFINSWNEFIYALVLISDDKYKTLPIALMNYSSGKYGTDYGGMFAAMIITSILPILLFIFFSNQVEKTFSAGSILK